MSQLVPVSFRPHVGYSHVVCTISGNGQHTARAPVRRTNVLLIARAHKTQRVNTLRIVLPIFLRPLRSLRRHEDDCCCWSRLKQNTNTIVWCDTENMQWYVRLHGRSFDSAGRKQLGHNAWLRPSREDIRHVDARAIRYTWIQQQHTQLQPRRCVKNGWYDRTSINTQSNGYTNAKYHGSVVLL